MQMAKIVHERNRDLQTLKTGLIALAWLALIVPMFAIVGSHTEPRFDGNVQEAFASGETVLLHYRATW